MGVLTDIEAAIGAAQTLGEATRGHAAVVAEVEGLVRSAETELTGSVAENEAALAALQSALEGLESALGGELAGLARGAEGLDARVDALQARLGERLDAQDRAVDDLLPRVQEAVTTAESALRSVRDGLTLLQAEDARLVAAAEAAADEVRARAAGVLSTVQGQHAALQRHTGELQASWGGLGAEVEARLAALEEAFQASARAAETAVRALLEETASRHEAVQTASRTALAEETATWLAKAAADLGAHATELRGVADRPRELAETELAAITKRLSETLKPLANLAALHRKAATMDLFEQ